MEIDEALEQLATLHRAVMHTRRADGSPQMSPVVCTLDSSGHVVVSSRETAMKVRNLRREPRAALCVFSEAFFGPWVQVEGPVELLSLPDAMDGLVDYYRSLSGEHPDWDEYRRAMTADKRVLVRLSIEKAGPDKQG